MAHQNYGTLYREFRISRSYFWAESFGLGRLWICLVKVDSTRLDSPKLCTAHNVFIPERLPYLCHIKKLGIVEK